MAELKLKGNRMTDTSSDKENVSGEKNVRLEELLSMLRKKDDWNEIKFRIFTERRFICAMDRAAACPDWWHVNRLHFYNPEMTHAHIARLLGLKREAVTRWIRNVEISEDDYEMLP